MRVSTRVEDHLVRLLEQDGWQDDEEAYEEALRLVIKEDEGCTWAQGNIRMGDYILLSKFECRHKCFALKPANPLPSSRLRYPCTFGLLVGFGQ